MILALAIIDDARVIIYATIWSIPYDRNLQSYFFIEQATGDNNCLSAIDIREYVDCSLAQPACLDLVEWLCHQPPFSRGPTFRCKRSILFYCLLHNFEF